MDTLVWLLALYARYFAVVFGVGSLVLGLIFFVSLRSQSRTSPDPAGAQPAAPERRSAA
ncbi:MAG TPA: hypothetical protein VEB59_03400 [Gemmatimonadales bacterium]|nr:hypothetical protein [Gemmatimonadales bacterium]